MSDPATIRIRPEQPEDATAIRRIHYLAFNGEAEADAVDAIRATGVAVLSLVAEEAAGALIAGALGEATAAQEVAAPSGLDAPRVAGCRLVGHVLFTPATVTPEHGEAVGLLGLAPVAVLPSCQGQGIGTMLVEIGLERLRAEGYPAVVVLGHPAYYPRFGFVPASHFGLRWEMDAPDEAFMALELSAGALAGVQGVVRFRSEFSGA
jgi:putative acetyltransferase